MNTDRHGVIDWLITQRQMLSIWLDDLEKAPASGNNDLAARLEEHERWLTHSISELASKP
ncbi:MAG: hypothetical protein AAF936_10460 [Pseudomonadota bacterium]